MTNLLKPTDNGLASLDEVRAWMEAQKESTVSETKKDKSDKRFIEYGDDAYTLYGIRIRTDTYDARITANPLDAHGIHSYNNWLAVPDVRTIKGESYDIPSLPEMIAVVRALRNHEGNVDDTQNKWIHRLRSDLAETINDRGMILNTIVDIGETTLASVRHSLRTNRSTDEICTIPAAVSMIKAGLHANYASVLYGWQDALVVDAALQWLVNTDTMRADGDLIFSSKHGLKNCILASIKTSTAENTAQPIMPVIDIGDYSRNPYAAHGIILNKREENR